MHHGADDGAWVEVHVPEGWVVVKDVKIERPEVVSAGGSTLIEVAKATKVVLRTIWRQALRVRLPKPHRSNDFLGRIHWRRDRGRWRPYDYLESGSFTMLELHFELGTRPAHVELRVGTELFSFECPGRPVKEPDFRLIQSLR